VTNSPLHRLSLQSLLDLAEEIERARVKLPAGAAALARWAPPAGRVALAAELAALVQLGFDQATLPRTLRLMAAERRGAQRVADRLELVWSGLETVGTRSRDTAIVVRDLFRQAKRTLLIASYALDEGDKARELFGELAVRMDTEPELRVRLFVNVHRKWEDTTPAEKLVKDFSTRFRDAIWPGERLPEVFHDPRSLSLERGPRACMHAKCVVADGSRAFISSANFTDAAHHRNIEAGVVVQDPGIAAALEEQFEGLVRRGLLVPISGQ
jgi:hypothetical protein